MTEGKSWGEGECSGNSIAGLLRFPILSAVGLRAEPATHLVKNKITNTEINLGTKKYADGELWAQSVFGDQVEFRWAGEIKDVRYWRGKTLESRVTWNLKAWGYW